MKGFLSKGTPRAHGRKRTLKDSFTARLDLLNKEYRAARSFVRVFFFKEVAWFYGGLMLLSLLLGLFFILFQ